MLDVGVEADFEDSLTPEGRVQEVTYNWPYDFFSLVELVKLEATVFQLSRLVEIILTDKPKNKEK